MALLAFLSPAVRAQDLLAAAQSQAAEPYEQLLSALRMSDSVVPPQLPVHPILTMSNREAIIPPQCYTKTGGNFNACYVCHQDAIDGRENVMNDRELQEAYSFSDLGMTNHWENLFEDRSGRIAEISDEWILEYVAQDNYSELPSRLEAAGFRGWIPDLERLESGAGAFDDQGLAKDGSHWVAFIYKPVPSTFWPTNGSTDDVMIRLPEPFRTAGDGSYSRDVYAANLAIAEAAIKGVPSTSIRGSRAGSPRPCPRRGSSVGTSSSIGRRRLSGTEAWAVETDRSLDVRDSSTCLHVVDEIDTENDEIIRKFCLLIESM